MESAVITRLRADDDLAPMLDRVSPPSLTVRPGGDRVHIDIAPDIQGEHIRQIAASIRQAISGLHIAADDSAIVLRYIATVRITTEAGWGVRLVFRGYLAAPPRGGIRAFR